MYKNKKKNDFTEQEQKPTSLWLYFWMENIYWVIMCIPWEDISNFFPPFILLTKYGQVGTW